MLWRWFNRAVVQGVEQDHVERYGFLLRLVQTVFIVSYVRTLHEKRKPAALLARSSHRKINLLLNGVTLVIQYFNGKVVCVSRVKALALRKVLDKCRKTF